MWSTDDTNDKDIFGNRPSDVHGGIDGQDVFGHEPSDAWGDPMPIEHDESRGELGHLFGWMFEM